MLIVETISISAGSARSAITAGPVNLGRNPQFHAGTGLRTHRVRKYLNSRKLRIYGGSNEIQRNIIAKAVLGL